MTDPITPAVPVYWRGKTYPLQLTLGALAGASGRLKIPILEGGENSLDAMPELAQRAVILYAVLHRKFPGITLADCEDALFEPARFKHYEETCAALMQGVIPHIEAIRKEQEKHRPPTAAEEVTESSGGDSGQPA